MSGPEDDAIAPTVVGPTVGSLAERGNPRDSRQLDQFSSGALLGRYQLKARLGAGAMGVVWSARDPQLDRDVAIKLVHPDLASQEASSRLLREARAMAKLSHRSVITVHDAGEADGTLFLAMELVRGTTLGQLLRKREPRDIADWRRWLRMMIEAGRGLAEAHRNGVLHRDFKPDNVLVDESGRVCVGDFGLAALGERVPSRVSTPVMTLDQSSSPVDLTSTGQLLGTPVYMSPQQLSGEQIDARADQFAFCVALYEAMYGKRPFASETSGLAAVYALIAQIVKGVPAPPAETTVPASIHDCIVRGLQVEPDQRWPDMDALIAALELGLRGKAAMTGAMPRRRAPVLPLAIAGVAVIGAGVAIYAATRSDDPATSPPSVERAAPKKLFGMALRTKMAVSHDGTRIALGGDGLWVRTLDGTKEWRPDAPIDSNTFVHLEVDDHDVVYSLENDVKRFRWHYATDNQITVDASDIGGRWMGTTVAGDVVRDNSGRLGLVRDKVLQPWAAHAEVVAVSPNRKRVAYIEDGRFNGAIAIRDVTTDRAIRSTQLDEPVALAWLDDNTLIFATSTLHEPRIYRAPVDNGVIGSATVIYAADTGWFADFGVGGGKLFFVSMPPDPSGRVIELATSSREDLGAVSLGLGWDAAGDLITWNRDLHYLERRTLPGIQMRPTKAKLDAEPANATVVGDLLIAALRRPGGRQATAVSLADGTIKWQHADKRTIAVRCAGDRQPPCFALRTGSDADRVVAIDPATGTLSDTELYKQDRIEDIAVRDDGAKVLAVGLSPIVREIDVASHEVSAYTPTVDGKPLWMSVMRSIGYAADGSIFIAGTVGRNRFQVGRIRDQVYSRLDETRDGLMMFVRPSSDVSRVVFVLRRYSPQLYELRL